MGKNIIVHNYLMLIYIKNLKDFKITLDSISLIIAVNLK